MRLKTLYLKARNSGQFNYSEIVEFIELAARAINPTISYNPQYIEVLIRHNLIGQVLELVLNSIEKNPSKVKFQVTKIFDRNGNLIKTIASDVQEN